MFYSVTWQDGNFEQTASVLSFYSKAARAAYPAQRVEAIDSKKKAALQRDGRLARLVRWDAENPSVFHISL
jgi:hypothetical protein